ncbi:MAG: cupin domain-containing protein [Desulfatiglandales bacterium]
MAAIGEKIKGFRERKGLSIRQLAEEAGCSPSLVSQLENNKVDPSISTLKKIARALGVNIVDFFMDEYLNHEEVVTSVKDRVDIHLVRWDARIQSLVRNTRNKKMQPFFTRIRPGGGSHGMYHHEGEEFGYVLKGQLSLILEDREYLICPQESFYFPSHIPHDWVNKGKEDVEVIWVITPPTF